MTDEKCGECNGKGKVAYDVNPFKPSEDLWEKCKQCDPEEKKFRMVNCPQCGGDGEIDIIYPNGFCTATEYCPTCKGYGEVDPWEIESEDIKEINLEGIARVSKEVRAANEIYLKHSTGNIFK